MKFDSIIKPPRSQRIKVGRIRLEPNEQVGEHTTDGREEMIVMLKGKASLLRDGKKIVLTDGQTQYISEGTKHNIINQYQEPAEYIYVVSIL